MLHVLYLIFNEGYVTSGGAELARSELSGEAIRLTRSVRRALPDDPEVAGLLALMLLTEARRPARTDANGELIPLDEQDRTLWNQDLIAEGIALIAGALGEGSVGEYQVQAAISAAHDQAARPEDTDWREIQGLYGLLERMTGNPQRHAVPRGSDNPQDLVRVGLRVARHQRVPEHEPRHLSPLSHRSPHSHALCHVP